MDLLRAMAANRQMKGADVVDPVPASKTGQKKETKVQKAKKIRSGTREMRHFIIEEKPSKKVVKEHFIDLVEQECVSSSDEDE
jgi:hypothetical protein